MFDAYIILISTFCGNYGARSYGVVCKDNGFLIFTKEEAEEVCRQDSKNLDVRYRVLRIADFFEGRSE